MKLKRFAAAALAALMAVSTCPVFAADKLVAFPGAEGGGMYSQGARAADKIEVYHVTNLNDSGAGSFVDAVSKDNRIIVFDVAGTIMLTKRLTIGASNLTILGQTAPGDGICIGGENVNFRGSNIIMRYLRFRMGYEEGKYGTSEEDGLGARGGHDIIFDHCSISWSVDEDLSVYQVKNFTAQYCIISESLNVSGHSKGAHGYGGIWGGVNSSFHHNLISTHNNRVPKIGTSASTTAYEDTQDHEGLVDIRNNVFYNWRSADGAYGGENGIRLNIVNNYYKPGPAGKNNTKHFFLADSELNYTYTNDDGSPKNSNSPTGPTMYINGNLMVGNDSITNDNQEGVEVNDPVASKAQYGPTKVNFANNIDDNVEIEIVKKPYKGDDTPVKVTVNNGEYIHDYPITTATAQAAYEDVLDNAGASFRRDKIDERVVENVRTGNAPNGSEGSTGLIDSQNDVGGWDAAELDTTPSELADTDEDGMPDRWEDQLGFDKAKNDAAEIGASGYTKIEEYANAILTESLEEVTVDKTELDNAINSAEALDSNIYTKDSFAAVSAALTKALSVLADENATQAEVDAALKALDEAMASLVIDGLGDIDNDGIITSNDSAAAYILSTSPEKANSGWKVERADVDNSGTVTTADAQKILQKVLKASVKF